MLTVGEILKREREKQKLTHEEIEKKLRIRKQFLEAVEAGDWSVFASKIYIIGTIKNYSQLLGLPTDKVLAFFRREYEKKEEVAFKRRVSTKLLTTQTRTALAAAVACIVVVLGVYFGLQVKALVTPPSVRILSPTTTTFRRESMIHIVAQTEQEAVVAVLGNRVFPDQSGKFSYDMPLVPGNNTLVIEVVGKNGKKTTVRQEYILQD